MLFTLPLVLTGLVHHFVVIRYNLFGWLALPVDGSVRVFGKALFGRNKTWRGFVVVILLNGALTYLSSKILSVRVTVNESMFVIGCLLGLGYSAAELITSFVKRQLEIIPSGQANGGLGVCLYLLDQSDSVLGSIFVANVLFRNIRGVQNIEIAGLGIGLHMFFDLLLYIYGYKQRLHKPFVFKTLARPEKLK